MVWLLWDAGREFIISACDRIPANRFHAKTPRLRQGRQEDRRGFGGETSGLRPSELARTLRSKATKLVEETRAGKQARMRDLLRLQTASEMRGHPMGHRGNTDPDPDSRM